MPRLIIFSALPWGSLVPFDRSHCELDSAAVLTPRRLCGIGRWYSQSTWQLIMPQNYLKCFNSLGSLLTNGIQWLFCHYSLSTSRVRGLIAQASLSLLG